MEFLNFFNGAIVFHRPLWAPPFGRGGVPSQTVGPSCKNLLFARASLCQQPPNDSAGLLGAWCDSIAAPR